MGVQYIVMGTSGVAVGRRLNFWLLTQTLVSNHEVPAVLAMWVQEDNLWFIETLLSLWVWWCPQHATKPRCSDHHGTQQPWAIRSVPLLLFSHLHGFSQTWAKLCLRILFMACFSLESLWTAHGVPENVDKHRTVANSMFVGLKV